MLTTLNLPEPLVQSLEARASNQQRSLDELVTDLLQTAVETDDSSLEELVAAIKATPPNPALIHPAQGSLAEALASLPDDPDFDQEQWEKEWVKAEAEMKAIEEADHLRDQATMHND